MLCFLQIEEADRRHEDDSFRLFYGLYSLNGHNSTSYIFHGLFFKGVLVFVRKLRGVFVFEITKTKTP